MALKPIPTGDAIAAAIKALAPPAGTPVSDALLKQIWETVCTNIDGDIQSNALVTGTVTSGSGSGGAVTGTVD